MKKSKKELEMLYNLWFDTNSSELLEGWPVEERDANYYVNQFYEQIVFDLPIPENGKLLVLGTHNCVSFDKLCIHFGYDRCIGFDLFNPQNHPSVIIKDCDDLSDKDDIELAFCHNDIGSFWKTPKLKFHCQKWAAKNIVQDGYFLGNNNYNRPRIELENRMKTYGFKNYHLLDETKFDHSGISISKEILQGYMLSKRVKK